MGLGQSLIPKCSTIGCNSQHRNNVEYIYNSVGNNDPNLTSYWVRSIGNAHTYWACKTCYDIIPEDYKKLFIHIPNYAV